MVKVCQNNPELEPVGVLMAPCSGMFCVNVFFLHHVVNLC